MKIKMRDGIFLDYHQYGSGQPIVLVHGFGSLQEIWAGQINFLVDHGYQVTVYDQRNHGASQILATAPQIMDLVFDLHDLITKLGLENPYLVGHSMGAGVVYGFLGMYPEIPIRGVIGIDQPPRMLSNSTWPYGYLDATDNNYMEKLLVKRDLHETLNGLNDDVWKVYYKAKQRKPFNLKNNIKLLVSQACADWRNALKYTQTQVLLVGSIQSPFFNYHYADETAKMNPDHVHAFNIDGAGHDVQAEIPHEFNQVMNQFLIDPQSF